MVGNSASVANGEQRFCGSSRNNVVAGMTLQRCATAGEPRRYIVCFPNPSGVGAHIATDGTDREKDDAGRDQEQRTAGRHSQMWSALGACPGGVRCGPE